MEDIRIGMIVRNIGDGDSMNPGIGRVTSATNGWAAIEYIDGTGMETMPVEELEPLELVELSPEEMALFFYGQSSLAEYAATTNRWPKKPQFPDIDITADDVVTLIDTLLTFGDYRKDVKRWESNMEALDGFFMLSDPDLEVFSEKSAVRWALDEIISAEHITASKLRTLRKNILIIKNHIEEGGEERLPNAYLRFRFDELSRCPASVLDEHDEDADILIKFAERIAKNEDNADAAYFLGIVYSDPLFKNHNPKKAVTYLMDAIGDCTEPWAGDAAARASCLLEEKDSDLSFRLATTAAALGSRKGRMLLGLQFANRGQFAPGENIFKNLIDEHLPTFLKGYTFPEVVHALINMAILEGDRKYEALARLAFRMKEEQPDLTDSGEQLMRLYQAGLMDRFMFSSLLQNLTDDEDEWCRMEDLFDTYNETLGDGDDDDDDDEDFGEDDDDESFDPDSEDFGMHSNELFSSMFERIHGVSRGLWPAFSLNWNENIKARLNVEVRDGGRDITVSRPDRDGHPEPFFFHSKDGEIYVADSVRVRVEESGIEDGLYHIDGNDAEGIGTDAGLRVLSEIGAWSCEMVEETEFDLD